MKKTLVVLLMLAAFSSMAFAQSGGQGRGQGGGQRGGGFFQRGGPGILSRQDVQKELKLTSSQVSKIESALQSSRGQGAGGGRGAGGGGNAGGGRGAGAGGGGQRRGGGGQFNAELDGKIKGILDDSQYKRYHQLMLQQAGGFALMQERVAKELGLTDSQKSELGEVSQDMRADMRDMFSNGGGGDRQAMMEEMQGLRADYGKQMLKVLTSAQKKKWDGMVGKPFKFQQIGR